MKAKKENKTYRIATEMEKQRYLKEGYDIYDDKGNILEYSPLKKISYSEYVKLQQENADLKEKIVRMNTTLAEQEAKIAEQEARLTEQESMLAEQKALLMEKQRQAEQSTGTARKKSDKTAETVEE